jgi:hypothetical protein
VILATHRQNGIKNNPLLPVPSPLSGDFRCRRCPLRGRQQRRRWSALSGKRTRAEGQHGHSVRAGPLNGAFTAAQLGPFGDVREHVRLTDHKPIHPSLPRDSPGLDEPEKSGPRKRLPVSSTPALPSCANLGGAALFLLGCGSAGSCEARPDTGNINTRFRRTYDVISESHESHQYPISLRCIESQKILVPDSPHLGLLLPDMQSVIIYF